MLIRIFILNFLALFLAGCTHHGDAGKSVAGTRVTQARKLPSFNHVVAEGQIDVSMHTGYAQPQVILRGDPRDLVQVVTEVKNNRLVMYLGAGHPRYGPVSADIRTRYLNSFVYDGGGTVSGMRLNSGLLDVSIKNPGTTRLGGNINLRKLEVKGSGMTRISGVRTSSLQLSMSGNPVVELVGVAKLSCLDLRGEGRFSLYWVKSDKLTIKARDNIFLQLAGIANMMNVELWDHARFKGRYLRASRVFVKTHNFSVAEISATRRQHALASDASDIYFYNLPQMKTDFMAYNGAVLDMRDWRMYSLQEYTRYNKWPI
ncbi:GIN domain-containing protein [Legionella spiritensis]|uniref:Putative auto-transporter adhesin head GIN domain-containing protein n=1 Tax=Legionella spiritensis TaxID=452 RepID=A0A0W0ZB31_LEGSP|nr:DUF2807 domain-containing protein [Legionella spiritensis]KTD66255.1 hypothetical protein Lspi_0018 [Legionella spiritensis]SNV48356.1 Protein of uncharacterised function (DUF2807) [Legionella spiritensis]VEG91466.1 Protein of uncharacterised function (DUF2807) [Legionella spiritensis]